MEEKVKYNYFVVGILSGKQPDTMESGRFEWVLFLFTYLNPIPMKNLFILVLVASLAACSSLKISYDYDKQADFKKYNTYAFTEEALKMPIDQLNRDRILKAVENEMAGKGFSKSDKPQVWIDLAIKSEKVEGATATTTGNGMYGGPWRYGYGGGFSTTQVNYYSYVDGTLFVNMVDQSTEKIVWQGRATKTIEPDISPEKREANINNAVKQIFAKYPPK